MHSRCVVPFEEFCTAGEWASSQAATTQCDPPTHPAVWNEHSHYGSWRPKARFQDEGLVRDVGCLNCIAAHSVKLVQPQLTFRELMKPLVNNTLCWARSTVRPVSQWGSTTIKMRNTMDHLLWHTKWGDMTQAHPIYGCPTPIVMMVLKSQFPPQLQIKHQRRQRQHIQNRVRFPVQCEDTVSSDGVSITNYTFTEKGSGLGFSYSPGKFWWVRTPVKGLVGRWRGTRLRLLPWRSSQWKVDHQWCQQNALHGKTSRTRAQKSFALLASEQTRWSVHDAVQVQAGKASCFQPSHASFPQNQVRPMRSCLVHNPPANIGNRGFVFAVGPITTLGLIGDSGRTVRSLSAASKHSIHPGRRRGTYFHPLRIIFLGICFFTNIFHMCVIL